MRAASAIAFLRMAVMWNAGRGPAHEPVRHRILIGLGEALPPAVLGLSMLTVTWILPAFGLRRTPRSELER